MALVSDIHGNLPALEAVVSDIQRRGVDQVVNLGDSLSGPLLPRETAQYLMDKGWLSVAGNHDRQVATQDPSEMIPSDAYAHSRLTEAEFRWLRSLPPCSRLAPNVFLCHGTPGSDRVYLLESIERGRVRLASAGEIESRLGAEESSLIGCGHSHVPRSVRASQGQLVVNPGSVGVQAFDDAGRVPHVVETGSPDARYAIAEKGREGWSVTLVSVPYDYRSMAKLARANGRPDWVEPLLTGYVA